MFIFLNYKFKKSYFSNILLLRWFLLILVKTLSVFYYITHMQIDFKMERIKMNFNLTTVKSYLLPSES